MLALQKVMLVTKENWGEASKDAHGPPLGGRGSDDNQTTTTSRKGHNERPAEPPVHGNSLPCGQTSSTLTPPPSGPQCGAHAPVGSAPVFAHGALLLICRRVACARHSQLSPVRSTTTLSPPIWRGPRTKAQPTTRSTRPLRAKPNNPEDRSPE